MIGEVYRTLHMRPAPPSPIAAVPSHLIGIAAIAHTPTRLLPAISLPNRTKRPQFLRSPPPRQDDAGIITVMRAVVIANALVVGIVSVAAAEPPGGDEALSYGEVRLYGRGDFDISYVRRRAGAPVVTTDLWRGNRGGAKVRALLTPTVAALVRVEGGFGTKDGRFVLMQDKVLGRLAYAGFETPLGTVTFGRQFPVSDAVTGIVDIALPGILSPYKSQFYWQIDRLEKSLLYSSPTVTGFQARLGYAFGEKPGAAGSSTLTAGVLFKNEKVEAGVSLESWKTAAFSKSSLFYNFWNLAASYDAGAAVLVAGFSSDDVNMDISSHSAIASRTYALGAIIPCGADQKVVILLQRVAPAKGREIAIGTVRYGYSLSKGTEVYSQINVANGAAADAYGVKSEFFIGACYRFDLRLWGR
jgi:predicted porin